MIKKVKAIVPNEIKDKIKGLISPTEHTKLAGIKDKQKIVVMLSGVYQNLGDVAIAATQIDMLKRAFPGYAIPEISSVETYTAKNAIKAAISKDDIIVLSGGGNMSDKYISLENARRYIISNFKENKIVSFPQTLIFSNDEKGLTELKKTCDIYNSHPNLTLFARDKESFGMMSKMFVNAKVLYCPDIVLSNKKYLAKKERDGVICCLRNDIESAVSNDVKRNFKKALISSFNKISFIDTVDISLDDARPDNRDQTLNEFIGKFISSQIVITDRLHGVIFSVITKTPCLAIPNKNQKITAICNEELSGIPYIHLFKEGEDIISEIKKLSELNTDDLPEYENAEAFSQLISSIKN